jgi:hypothetical protein
LRALGTDSIRLLGGFSKNPPHGVVSPMQEKNQRYWKKINVFSAISIFFDPRSKMELLDFLLCDEINAKATATCLQKIKSSIFSWFSDVT